MTSKRVTAILFFAVMAAIALYRLFGNPPAALLWPSVYVMGIALLGGSVYLILDARTTDRLVGLQVLYYLLYLAAVVPMLVLVQATLARQLTPVPLSLASLLILVVCAQLINRRLQRDKTK